MLFSASPLSSLDRDPGDTHRPTTREPRQPPPQGKAKRTQGNQGGAAGAGGWVGGKARVRLGWRREQGEGLHVIARMFSPYGFHAV